MVHATYKPMQPTLPIKRVVDTQVNLNPQAAGGNTVQITLSASVGTGAMKYVDPRYVDPRYVE